MSGKSKNDDSGYHPQKGGAHSSANNSPDIRQETGKIPKTFLFRQETARTPLTTPIPLELIMLFPNACNVQCACSHPKKPFNAFLVLGTLKYILLCRMRQHAWQAVAYMYDNIYDALRFGGSSIVKRQGRWGKVGGRLRRNTHHQTVCLCLSVLCINPVKDNYV